jgi:DNA-binding transcriptional LysR family regulator
MKIDDAHIRRLDLSLLLVFKELMHNRRTTVVAERMGMSQSAVSHALSRLREIFRDPLFLRKSDGLQPTRRALELLPKVEALINLAYQTVNGFDTFDPATADRLFRLAGNDLVCTLLGGPLINSLRGSAPLARVTFRSAVGRAALGALASGHIDIALGHFPALPTGYDVTHLFEESFVVVARQGHPKLRKGLALDLYLELDHVLVSFTGGLTGFADMALKPRKLTRRVVASLPMFLATFAAVANGNIVATVPARLAASYAKPFGLKVHQTPMPVRSFSVIAVRHARSHGDPGLDWLIESILALVKIGPGRAPLPHLG